MSELPLKLYFQQETPYSALTHSAHVQIIMWGSLVTLILISLLWFHAERMFSKSWIVAVRWLLLAALTTSPMPVGIAFVRSVSALRTVAPDGFYFEHGLRLGLWGLVPEAVLLFILGAILKHFRCLPPIL
ncbi:hypothetical protein L226DRAFT_537187 [Lentinus tigrinus ALCF2SS1-7]|uniref:uncharacterized protein n=1 Tax=Lentinus tigrinus ALCF2SS1-7 TaxID=1328758 RepID=UPI00116604A5|nr:hypothetical protein L226DRAFT_537187 [Lentinus tigrinus ALCF2SS1-7]